MQKTTLKIDGMSCGHCQKAVQEGLSAVPGVQNVDVSLDAGTADVTYDEAATDIQAMTDAVVDAGYTVL